MNWTKFVLYISAYLSQKPPQIYGPACIVRNDQLYIVGGFQSSVKLRNQLIYNIGLEDLVKNNSSWSNHTLDLEENLGPFFSGVGLSDNSGLITGISPEEPFFKIHEVDFKTFEITEKPSTSSSKLSSKLPPYYNQKGISIIENDINSNEFIIYSSGIKKDEDLDIPALAYIYNSRLNSLKQINNIPQGVLKYNFHSIAVYKGVMYVIGGYNEAGPRNMLYGLNIGNMKWDLYETSGNIPEKQCGFSYTQVEHLLYATGGEDCKEYIEFSSNQDGVYVLNLLELTWDTHYINGFEGSRQGCLTFYNDSLIHVLGYFNTKPVQSIDTNNWRLISHSKPKKDKSSEGDVKSINIVIVGMISSILVLSLLVWFFYRWRNDKLYHSTIVHRNPLDHNYNFLSRSS